MKQNASRAEREIARKHADQIAFHEQQFGKLGEFQTKPQKAALRKANSEPQKKGA